MNICQHFFCVLNILLINDKRGRSLERPRNIG